MSLGPDSVSVLITLDEVPVGMTPARLEQVLTGQEIVRDLRFCGRIGFAAAPLDRRSFALQLLAAAIRDDANAKSEDKRVAGARLLNEAMELVP